MFTQFILFAGTAFAASLDSQIEDIRNKFMSAFVLRQKELEEEISRYNLVIKVDQITYLLSASSIQLFSSLINQYPAVTESFSQKVRHLADAVFVEDFDQLRNQDRKKQGTFLHLFLERVRYTRQSLLAASISELQQAFITPKVTRNSLEKSVLSVSSFLGEDVTRLSFLNALAYKGLLSIRDTKSLRISRIAKPSRQGLLSLDEARCLKARLLARSVKRRFK